MAVGGSTKHVVKERIETMKSWKTRKVGRKIKRMCNVLEVVRKRKYRSLKITTLAMSEVKGITTTENEEREKKNER